MAQLIKGEWFEDNSQCCGVPYIRHHGLPCPDKRPGCAVNHFDLVCPTCKQSKFKTQKKYY